MKKANNLVQKLTKVLNRYRSKLGLKKNEKMPNLISFKEMQIKTIK